MRSCFTIWAFLFPCILFGQSKPNIIVIFTDDQGFADLGVQGEVTDILTPNIDRLAQNGVRMTSGYVTAPQCIPSRAGLITGRYQQRFGVDHNGTRPLPLDEVLIPQRLKKAGYATGFVGKWHLEPNHVQKEWIQEHLPQLAAKAKPVPSDIPMESKLPYRPGERGFDDIYAGAMRSYQINYTLEGKDVEPQRVQDDRFRLDVQSDAAVAFINRHQEEPFFLYLGYFAPHVPLEASEKYLARFPGDMPTRRRYCLAMMSAIDDGVGRIQETLKSAGIAENTLIFFISDNGAPLKIDKEDKPISFVAGAWDGSLNDPFVGEKGMVSEGGIRVPYIVSWPAMLPRGKVYHKPVISLDVAATAVAVAGLETAPELDGVNLIPFLSGTQKGPPHEALYWRFWNQSAIRMGKWKLLKAGDSEWLFNVNSKKHERKNLIGKHPEKARELKANLREWAAKLYHPGVPEGPVGREKRWYDHYFE